MFKLRLALDYFGHWLNANSRHGVHSPFVYRLVDEVIYNFRAQTSNRIKGFKSEKVNRLVERLADFFKKDCTDLNDSADFMIIRHGVDAQAEFILLLQKVRPDTVLIVEGIYRDKKIKDSWKAIKTNPKVSVSIDLFDLGLVFFREGQAKEDFKIRF